LHAVGMNSGFPAAPDAGGIQREGA